MPAMIDPARVIANAAVPTIPITYRWIVGPLNDHHAPDDRTSADIHDAPGHRAMHHMAVNNNVPVVPTPAVPMAGLHGSGLGKGAKTNRA